ncbi:MAG: hypothetical protein K1X56_00130 [Flavobacteriales bacterium]|nr:hypothetical protein [Flavobacteriales bacterium]
MIRRAAFFLFLLAQFHGFAQEQLITVGMQYKPIFASKFFGAGEVSASDSNFTVSVKPTWGHSYGMIIRRGFTKTISLETGINYVRRRYGMSCTDTDSGFTDKSDFSIISYEIPTQMLIYVRLGERFYMNNAFGLSLTAFASDVESHGTDQRFFQYSRMTTNFLSAALIANVGFEYRSKKAGFYYLGASFHKPVKNIANSYATYNQDPFRSHTAFFDLTGTYLTVDLRYFFHEAPVKPKKKKKS